MCGGRRLRPRDVTYESEVDTKATDGNVCDEFFQISLSTEERVAALERDKDIEVKLGVKDPWSIGARARAKMLRFAKDVDKGTY